MGGGLMQLVAYGAQDIYLTGNPQITFFKVVYRRHTNFSMESIEQTINGNVAAGSRVTSTISRNGDLVHRLYYQITSSDKAAGVVDQAGTTTTTACANFGARCFANIELEIGGQRIDRQSGEWMELWAELSESNTSRIKGTLGSAGTGTLFQEMSGMGGCSALADLTGDLVDGGIKVCVPLQFWFCRNPGLALPLIALQYHEVKVVTSFSSVTGTGTGFDAQLWADYIYLDTDERRRFAQVSHEYLIEQVQFQSAPGTDSTSDELNFNHPVKELIWTGGWGAGGELNTVPTGKYQLKLNGHDRFSAREQSYFTKTQVWQHHSGPGGIDAEEGGGVNTIAVYSFALKPEEHQPSGTCNFSRIDNAQLTHTSGKVNVYAVNYNVLRIMSGMGGLAYSN